MDRSVRLRALWRPITLAVAACASASIGHGQDPSWSLLRGGPDPTTRTSLIPDLARQVPAERVLQRLKENPQAFRGSSGCIRKTSVTACNCRDDPGALVSI